LHYIEFVVPTEGYSNAMSWPNENNFINTWSTRWSEDVKKQKISLNLKFIDFLQCSKGIGYLSVH
jgi:hypothetical protein